LSRISIAAFTERCRRFRHPQSMPEFSSLFGWDRCIVRGARNHLATIHQGVKAMSKGMNSKKQTRKAPAKSMLEKRAAKRGKKAGKGAMR
jgi:hypothetical protein